MRHIALATIIIIASLGAPLLASAQLCTSVGATCTSFITGAVGICQDTGDGYSCEPTGGTPGGSVGSPGTGGTTGGSVGKVSPLGTNVTLINPLQGGGSLESFLLNILAFVIRIGTVVVILMTVYVGYLFVAARGEPGKITEARSALLWTIVGALILLGSQAIAIGIKATVQAISVGQ